MTHAVQEVRLLPGGHADPAPFRPAEEDASRNSVGGGAVAA
ncbi:hypothetical protein [Streptomyces sp. NPDC101149]